MLGFAEKTLPTLKVLFEHLVTTAVRHSGESVQRVYPKLRHGTNYIYHVKDVLLGKLFLCCSCFNTLSSPLERLSKLLEILFLRELILLIVQGLPIQE
jgi:hypothetical protein